MRSRHLSCVIEADPDRVYDVVVDPDQLPRWAEGLARADVRRDGDELIVDSPMGLVRVRFVARNTFGVADHRVTLPGGMTVTNHLRVLPHPAGCEVVFTIRQLDSSDDEFDQDCRMVELDLQRLKSLAEARAS